MKNTGLGEVVIFFSVDFKPIDTNNNFVIQQYLMKKNIYIHKIMLRLIKKIFLGLLTDIVTASNHTKCVSLSHQCIIQPTHIIL